MTEEMTNEFNEMTALEEIDETTEENNGNLAKAIVIGTVATLGTAAVAAVVSKKLKIPERINERRKRKLEKAGYVIFKKDELELDSDECSEVEDTEE